MRWVALAAGQAKSAAGCDPCDASEPPQLIAKQCTTPLKITGKQGSSNWHVHIFNIQGCMPK